MSSISMFYVIIVVLVAVIGIVIFVNDFKKLFQTIPNNLFFNHGFVSAKIIRIIFF